MRTINRTGVAAGAIARGFARRSPGAVRTGGGGAGRGG